MNTVPNQKIIKIYKAPCDEKHKYSKSNKHCEIAAMKELTFIEFKVYRWILLNQDHWEFALSTKKLANDTGANQRSIQRAINTLIEKGFIKKFKGNLYAFSDYKFECTNHPEDVEIVHTPVKNLYEEFECTFDSEDTGYNTQGKITDKITKITDKITFPDTNSDSISDEHSNQPSVDQIKSVIRLFKAGRKYSFISKETALTFSEIRNIIEQYKIDPEFWYIPPQKVPHSYDPDEYFEYIPRPYFPSKNRDISRFLDEHDNIKDNFDDDELDDDEIFG